MTRDATHSNRTIELAEPSSLPPSLSGAPGEPGRPLFEGSLREHLENPFRVLPVAQGVGLRRALDPHRRTKAGIKVGGLILLIALGATLGGVLAVHPSFNSNEVQPTEVVTEQQSAPAPVVAVENTIEYRASEPKSIAVSDAAPQSEQSNIIAHAQGLPIQLAPRQFLLAQGGARTIPNSYVTAPVDPAFHRMVEPELIDMGAGRYSTTDEALDWQGGFTFGDSAANLRQGEGYSKYLDSKIGSPFTNKLSTTTQQPSKLLPKVSRAK